MCGRFTIAMDFEELQEAFPGVDFGYYLKPNYNVAPSQQVLAIPNFDQQKALPFHWGLIPFWAKDKSIGYKMINARAETLHEKPSFKKPYRKQRCLIPASGFFEWQKSGAQKTPIYIHLKSGKPFAFAGLWEKWSPNEQETVHSCTIITTQPNELLSEIHNRMPVIINPENYQKWLDSKIEEPEELADLLSPFPSDEMAYHAVSTFVNSPKNNSSDCIKAVS